MKCDQNAQIKMENKIVEILESAGEKGVTITELVAISLFSRSAVRTSLARLEGAGKVSMRKAGMAKIYSLKPQFRQSVNMIISMDNLMEGHKLLK